MSQNVDAKSQSLDPKLPGYLYTLDDHDIDYALPSFTAFLARLVLSACRDWHDPTRRDYEEAFLLSDYGEATLEVLRLPDGGALIDRLHDGLDPTLLTRLRQPVKSDHSTKEQARARQRRHYHKRKVRGKNLTLATQLPLLVF